jgi:hypothetical protein
MLLSKHIIYLVTFTTLLLGNDVAENPGPEIKVGEVIGTLEVLGINLIIYKP